MSNDLTLRHSRNAGWKDAAWDAFVASHPQMHPLQLSVWGDFKAAFGWESLRVALVREDKFVAGAQVLFKKLPGLGPMAPRLAYIPKGPLVDWANARLVANLFASLRKLVRQQGAVMLRVEPDLLDTPAHRRLLAASGFSPAPHAIQPQTTVWVDLTADEDAILARMKQKWRYNVRLATRKGVTVRVGDANDVAKFIALMQTTGRRKDFGVHTPEYYRRFWQMFAPSGHAALLLATFEEEPLAGVMLAQLGDKAYYFYGASGNKRRNLMPSHLLQWEAMRWAKSRGCTAYDLWGVPDEVGLNPDAPIPDPPTGMWGVWRFKRGFGGEIVRYVGAWERGCYPFVLSLARRFGY